MRSTEQKWWCWMTQIPRQSKWSDKIFQQPKYSPNSVPLLSMTAEQAVTSCQKRLQNAKQRVEVIIVQHPDRAKTVPELRIFHPTVRLRMLERWKNPANILARDHLQPNLLASCKRDSMGIIFMWKRWRWIGHEQRARQRLRQSPLLDIRGEAVERATQEHLRLTVEGELETLHHAWGTVQKLAQNRQEWCTFIDALHANRHNGHKWVWVRSTERSSKRVIGGIYMDYFMESARVRYLRTSFLKQKRVRKYHTKHFPCCNLFILYLLRFFNPNQIFTLH